MGEVERRMALGARKCPPANLSKEMVAAKINHWGTANTATIADYDRLANEPWVADLIHDVRNGEEWKKSWLPFRCAHLYRFAFGRRNQNSLLREAFLWQTTVDIDDCDAEKQQAALERALQLNEETDGAWQGMVLQMERSARGKVHMDIRMPIGMTIQEAQLAFIKALGVDVEVVSSTKYLSGGGTSLGGLVIDYGTFPEINKRVKYELLFNLGAYMTPQAAYMQTLGLETLDVRYQRQAGNALWLAQELSKVVKVNYVGLENNPYHALALQQFGPTAGAMFTIDLASKEACFRFLNRLQLVHRATNLFDSRTLAIHPASTIFGNFPEEQLAEMDVRQTTIRLSIGLENKEDILNDILQALG